MQKMKCSEKSKKDIVVSDVQELNPDERQNWIMNNKTNV